MFDLEFYLSVECPHSSSNPPHPEFYVLISLAAFHYNIFINSMILYCWYWKVVQYFSSSIVYLCIKGWFGQLISRRKLLILEIFHIISPKEMKSSENNHNSYKCLNTKILEFFESLLVGIFKPGEFSWHSSFGCRRQFQIQVNSLAAVWAFLWG